MGQTRPCIRSTHDIIKAANNGRLPDQIMMTFHPQRWNDAFMPWVNELVWQNVKNLVKQLIVFHKKLNADQRGSTRMLRNADDH